MSKNRNSNRERTGKSRGNGNSGHGYNSHKDRKKSSGKSVQKVIEEVVGTVTMARDGYGFIIVPEREDDIFVSAKKLRGALHGDTVRVAVVRKKDATHRMEGEVIEVVERSKKPYIGILQIIGNQAWVIVESKYMPYDISVPIEQVKKEDQGLKVAVRVESWKHGMDAPLGNIVDILGTPGENNTEMHAILAEYGLPYKFTEEVENAAGRIPVKITDKEMSGRKDFRNTCTFTIDPADAKDFDDAISLKKLDSGNWEVGVHIADVTYYVRPGDMIDKEAVDRGTSVYLVDRTVPMLPEVLSNNLCSLRPNEEKLTFSAVFEMNDKAKVIKAWFGRTIIKSDRRFAYEEAQAILEEAGLAEPSGMSPADIPDNKPVKKVRGAASEQEVNEAVITLQKLAAVLRKNRFEHGSISFERPEMKVIVDEKGNPVDVRQKITREANWLIEEFMLLANKAVATYVATGMRIKDPTFVYRIHDEPDFDKIQNLRDFVKHFGYSMGATDNAREVAGELNKLLDKIKDKPECNAIEIIALRSMARARYSTDNVGHYGLGFEYYTHFTSPIRRYPDMMVHRLLAHYLDKGKSEDKKKYEELCKHSSSREQVATEAERSSIKYKLTEFMQDKIGNIYEGTISGVTEWGLYVEIEPTKVEGMVMLRDIKEDYFEFDEKNYCVIGKSTRMKFTLGDKVKIKVAKANLEQKLIDYLLIWEDSYNKGKTKKTVAGERDRGRGKTAGRRRDRRPGDADSSPKMVEEPAVEKKPAFYEAVMGKTKKAAAKTRQAAAKVKKVISKKK